jgi:predicted branched-subunit amino acid permease
MALLRPRLAAPAPTLPDAVPVTAGAAPAAPAAARIQFLCGFAAMAPLWAGAIPVGIVYGAGARAAGLGAVQTQLMSVLVFSAAAQLSAVSLFAVGAPAAVVVGSAVALNAQLVLLGVGVGRQARLAWPHRLLVAAFLTDGAYGVTAGRGRLRVPELVGAGVSMFVAWNTGTALGALALDAAAGASAPRLLAVGLDMVVPLTFLAVLVPLLRTPEARLAAAASGAAALLLAGRAPGGSAVLIAGVAGCAVGAWWMGRSRSSGGAPTAAFLGTNTPASTGAGGAAVGGGTR